MEKCLNHPLNLLKKDSSYAILQDLDFASVKAIYCYIN